MKISVEALKEIENAYTAYENEISKAEKKRFLKKSTSKTYLLHSKNFIKWCKNDFEPGKRNK